MGIRLSDNNGDVCRFNVEHDIIDAVVLSLGAVYYETTESEALLTPYKRNDKYVASLKYSF